MEELFVMHEGEEHTPWHFNRVECTYVASVTIADAAIFIISLLLLFDIIDILHARTQQWWKDNICCYCRLSP